MNYELAKELKDAGFPQDKIKLPEGETTVPENVCYVPTLEGK